MLGVLGGMGPAATVDFLAKVVRLTPACRDQEHIPVLVASLPQVPDRSAAIMGRGPSPLPALLGNLRILVDAGARAVAMPCNTGHHWFERLQAHSPVPLLHIAEAALDALPEEPGAVLLLATRGTLQSGFYQERLDLAGRPWVVPDGGGQRLVDEIIAAVKMGNLHHARTCFRALLEPHGKAGRSAAILGCTELPLAADAEGFEPPFALVDSTLELARACVAHALSRGWNRARPALAPGWPARGAERTDSERW